MTIRACRPQPQPVRLVRQAEAALRAGPSNLAKHGSSIFVLLALLVAFSQGPELTTRAAADGLETSPRTCGYPGAGPGMDILPGGGGDTVVVGGPNRSIRIYDSSSPVLPGNHDRLMLPDVSPRNLRRLRAGDHLVLCEDAARLEVVIENQFCRAAGDLSVVDTFNNEIEEIIFPKTGEIWLTDVLYARFRANPKLTPFADEMGAYGTDRKPSQWRIRPFSSALPKWSRKSGDCRQK